jgi:hypothetical protein
MYVLLLCSTCMFETLLLLQSLHFEFFYICFDKHNAVCHTHSVKYLPHIILFRCSHKLLRGNLHLLNTSQFLKILPIMAYTVGLKPQTAHNSGSYFF